MSKIPAHYYNFAGLLMFVLPILGLLLWALYVTGGFQLILFCAGLFAYIGLTSWLMTRG